MGNKVMVKGRIDKFLNILGNIVDTYKAFPYFSTPSNVFEGYISDLLEYKKLHEVETIQLNEITETMKSIITFITNVIPSTAIVKAKFLDDLNGEYQKLLHVMEMEHIQVKAE